MFSLFPHCIVLPNFLFCTHAIPGRANFILHYFQSAPAGKVEQVLWQQYGAVDNATPYSVAQLAYSTQ